MNDWQQFLTHIRKAYRDGYSPDRGDHYNHAKDPETSHVEWEEANLIALRMVINGDPEARKAARLSLFVQDHPRIGWWYG